MNEVTECWACTRPGVLVAQPPTGRQPWVMQHDEGGAVRQCALPPRDVPHPDHQRAHRRNRYPSPYRQRVVM